MNDLEETNRDFLHAHPLPPIVTEDLLAVLREQSLDDWYQQLNRTYWNRNFHRDASAIFMHLVEVLGSLSLLVTKKNKPSVDKGLVYEFMAKAFAWWLALSGKVGIRSVAAMLWLKFPLVCPYCQKPSHSPGICGPKKKANRGPDWDALRDLGKSSIQSQPKSLGAWQRMFNEIYETHNEDYPMVFAKLTEEMGELAEALRAFPSEPGIFLSESSDVFAWLMKLMNLFESQELGLDADDRGQGLEDALARAYPRRCTDCHALICSCPPILPTTIGRLAHEVPGKLVSYDESGLFLTPERLSKWMGPA
jgi:NTP pyrophosphatase (non-canonical NTP hydrolase)